MKTPRTLVSDTEDTKKKVAAIRQHVVDDAEFALLVAKQTPHSHRCSTVYGKRSEE